MGILPSGLVVVTITDAGLVRDRRLGFRAGPRGPSPRRTRTTESFAFPRRRKWTDRHAFFTGSTPTRACRPRTVSHALHRAPGRGRQGQTRVHPHTPPAPPTL